MRKPPRSLLYEPHVSLLPSHNHVPCTKWQINKQPGGAGGEKKMISPSHLYLSWLPVPTKPICGIPPFYQNTSPGSHISALCSLSGFHRGEAAVAWPPLAHPCSLIPPTPSGFYTCCSTEMAAFEGQQLSISVAFPYCFSSIIAGVTG